MSSSPTRLHVGPGELWTGTKRYACDGAVVDVVLRDPEADEPEVERLTIVQLHDINVSRHRTQAELREHLRRCLRLLVTEGVLITKADQPVLYARAGVVRTSPQLALHAFHRQEKSYGPFRSTGG